MSPKGTTRAFGSIQKMGSLPAEQPDASVDGRNIYPKITTTTRSSWQWTDVIQPYSRDSQKVYGRSRSPPNGVKPCDLVAKQSGGDIKPELLLRELSTSSRPDTSPCGTLNILPPIEVVRDRLRTAQCRYCSGCKGSRETRQWCDRDPWPNADRLDQFEGRLRKRDSVR